MESLSCELCGCPTFLCNCDSTWTSFNLLKNLGKTNDKITFTDVNVSTITVCFKYNQSINLPYFYENRPKFIDMTYKPSAKKAKEKKKKGTDSFYNSFEIKMAILDREIGSFSNISVYLFPNGKIKIAGSKTVNVVHSTIEELTDIINYVEGSIDDHSNLVAENIKIQMICSDFKVKPIKEDTDGWCIKQEVLKNILVTDYHLSATFSALSKYPGINLKYPSVEPDNKPVSIFIFRSGSIIITGAKNAKDILSCYEFINKVIYKSHSSIFYYDINEELKQKKKKNKIAKIKITV